MKSGRMSRFGRLAACAVALLTTTCTDDTGPTVSIEGHFALAPSFASSVAGIVDIREIRFTLARGDGSVAKDTVMQIAPGADSVALELTVPIRSAGEQLSLVVAMMDAAGTVMFTGGPVDVVPGMPGSEPPMIPLVFDYVGPGADAAGIAITTAVSEVGILTGDTIRLSAVALDSAGEPIAGTPIAWRSLDSAHAVALADPTSGTYGGLAIGRTQRGTAPVVAELLTGPADTTSIAVQPVPVTITLTAGNGQSATIGTLLPDPLVAQVVASDGLGVGGVWVYCTPSAGTVVEDSSTTDPDGQIAVYWNLGSTAGQHSLELSVARFPSLVASFTVTALPAEIAAITVSPTSATLDAIGAQVQLSATASDSAGNVIPDAVITWTSESDLVATVDPTGLVTAVAEGLIDVGASADTVTTWVPITVNQVATDLAFTVQPSDVTAGAPIAPPVDVGVLDRLGSIVADATDAITITILDNPSGGTLSGTTTVAATNGIASFADLSIDQPGAFYRLEAGAAGLNIAESNTFDVLPRAAPPPGSIVFAGDSSGTTGTPSRGLFSVNPDGSGRTRFYDLQSLNDARIHPRWSPGRTRVAYTWRPSGFGNPNELRMIEPPVADVVSLVFDTSAFYPRWSPNGIHLAFECGDGFSVFDVCVIADVTGDLTTLGGIGNGAGKVYVTAFDPVNRKDGPGSFAWDPLDYDRIAFVRDSSDGVNPPSSRIYTDLYDGTARQPVSPEVMDAGGGPLQIVGSIDWSPNGQQLVFAAVDPTGQQEIYVINRDGSGLAALTATANQWEDDPLWSPTGTEILFTRDLGCDFDAWLMNADGSNARKVTAERVCDFDTDLLAYDWSPDGQDIVLTGFYAPYDGPVIYRIPRTTTAATYFTDRVLIGRYGASTYEVQDIQPSWRP